MVANAPDEIEAIDMDTITRQALDCIPVRRITRSTLERYRLIPRQLAEPQLYSGAADGNEYRYRSLLEERVHEGIPQVLVDWRPTWEPVANIRQEDLRALHNAARDARSQRSIQQE
jgi:hypothetical protein